MQEVAKYGEIFLALNYLPKAGRLSVDILKCKALSKKDGSHKVGELFLRLYNIHPKASLAIFSTRGHKLHMNNKF